MWTNFLTWAPHYLYSNAEYGNCELLSKVWIRLKQKNEKLICCKCLEALCLLLKKPDSQLAGFPLLYAIFNYMFSRTLSCMKTILCVTRIVFPKEIILTGTHESSRLPIINIQACGTCLLTNMVIINIQACGTCLLTNMVVGWEINIIMPTIFTVIIWLLNFRTMCRFLSFQERPIQVL